MSVSDENTRIQVTIPKEIKQKLKDRAREHDRSISNYIVTLIKKDLAEK
jgi:hypothetical protein